MRDYRRRSALSWVLVIALALSTMFGIFWDNPTPVNPSSSKLDPNQEALLSAVARIEYESTYPRSNPSIETSPSAIRDVNTSTSKGESIRNLHDGYSLTKFRGKMAKGVLDSGKRNKTRSWNPKSDWLSEPHAIHSIVAQAKDAGRDWSFGVLLLEEDANYETLVATLLNHDVEPVGASGRLVRAKLPSDERLLNEILALPAVAAIAPIPADRKISEESHQVFMHSSLERLPVFITLMESDVSGRWRRILETLGITVGYFDPSIRVYAAVASYDSVVAIAQADFVVAVEPVGISRKAHDTVIPSMGADALRMYDYASDLFTGIGGESVPIAVMDTGLNRQHVDIATNRASICGANFVYFDPLYDDADLWVDEDGHGSHVTGTIVGNGTALPQYAGFAPLVQHIRFAKVLNHTGIGNNVFILRGMEYLQNPIECTLAGNETGTKAIKPLVVNMSLSARSLSFDGREATSRKLDAVVWEDKQLYVVAHANSDIHGFSNYAAAKNSLGVGATLDNGALASFSSLGPTADGRLSPLIVGTGVDVNSTAGNNSRTEYQSLSGTSMSSPAVAGAATLLMDALPEYREQPALTRARLLASAIKADAWIEGQDHYRPNNNEGPGELQARYGLGLVSARTSVFQRDRPNGWQSGSAIVELHSGEYGYVDIEVVENTARLDLVLTWDEPPADAFASTVINDLDLWFDQGADCQSEPCGEYASKSRIDNVEWIILSNPEPGMYRAKVAGSRIYTDSPRAALAWTALRDVSTPTLTFDVGNDIIEVSNITEEIHFSIELTTDGYVAAGTRIQIDCRTIADKDCGNNPNIRVTSNREDSIDQQLELKLGDTVELGELAEGETWSAQITFSNIANANIDAYRLYFKANAWNGNSDSESILVRRIGSPELNVSPVTEPANDDFVDAELLEGGDGEFMFDLIRSTAESGELQIASDGQHPMGSIWFKWVAPTNDKSSFVALPVEMDSSSSETVDISIFQGSDLTSLKLVARGLGSTQFFTQSGENYWVRVSHLENSIPHTLVWSTGPPPINDRFANALPLAGEAGSVQGSNVGATTETGESFGDLAGSVWYRWESPIDGDILIEVDSSRLVVIAFTGERLNDLRLVSTVPSSRSSFRVRSGEVYYLAVAAKNPRNGGSYFNLNWRANPRTVSNDDFESAIAMLNGERSYEVDVDSLATVQPREPAESGIRTKWWVWTAPATTEYTWYLDELTRETRGATNKLMLSVFSGSRFEDLETVATNGSHMASKFKFTASQGQRYWFASGLPTDYYWAFVFDELSATLVMGETPANDDLSRAVRLESTRGSLKASNEFATSTGHERIDRIGRSTLWWSFEVQESGFFRFSIDEDNGGEWILSLHNNVEDGINDRTMINSDPNTVVAYLSKGIVYTLGVGARGAYKGGEFTLRWEPITNPTGLRYVGRFADGDADIQGAPVSISQPSDLLIHPSGNSLYLLSDGTLHVFDRSSTTGELSHVQRLDIGRSADFASILWDEVNNRLLLSDCIFGRWRAFAYAEDSAHLRQVSDPPGHSGACPHILWLIDRTGSNIYGFWSGGNLSAIHHYSSHTTGDVSRLGSYEINTTIRGGALTNDGEHFYVTASDGLRTYAVDSSSGALVLSEYQDGTFAFKDLTVVAPVVVTNDDAFIVVFDDRLGLRANLLSIEDPERPALITRLDSFLAPSGFWQACEYADVRKSQNLIDVICNNEFATLRIDREAGLLEHISSVFSNKPDLFNSLLPDLGTVGGLAVSPDARFLYVSSGISGVIILDRDLTPSVENEPDLFIFASVIEKKEVYQTGNSFGLQATVRNREQSQSGLSTLYFYQSTDSEITPDDTSIGIYAMSSLSIAQQAHHSIRLRVPLEPETYYYGACVEEVTDEESTANNCSEAVSITVIAP